LGAVLLRGSPAYLLANTSPAMSWAGSCCVSRVAGLRVPALPAAV